MPVSYTHLDVYKRQAVTDIKVKTGKLNSGGLKVTVKYEGKEYELHGVPSGAHFKMKSSKASGIPTEAWLYEGELYYAPNCIFTWIDKVYYFFLAGTVCFAAAFAMQVTGKYRRR